MTFDPYHEWLGIPPSDQPPNHYRLLGIALFEADPDVVSQAANQRMAQIRSLRTGAYADLSQRMLNEVTGARLCLLNPDTKRDYDAELRKRLPSRPPLPQAEGRLPAAVRERPALGAGTRSPLRKSTRDVRRPSSNFVWLALGATMLALTLCVAALAVWLQRRPSPEATPKHPSVSSSPAVAESEATATGTAPAPHAGEQSDELINDRTAVQASRSPPEPVNTDQPSSVGPEPGALLPPAFAPLSQEPKSSTGIAVEKKKTKKKPGKKPAVSGPKWKTVTGGYPLLAGDWQGDDGQRIAVIQEGDQFTASAEYSDAEHGEIRWRWSGTIDRGGHLSGRCVYTKAPSGFQDEDRSAVLSPDGKSIRWQSASTAGGQFTWKRSRPKASPRSK